MKYVRVFLASCIAFFVPLLTSCKVNWFTKQYDVPWYYVAIPVTIFVVIVFVLAHIHIMSGTYICPKCGSETKPKWYQIYAYIHLNDQRIVKCPNCNRKGFCKRKKSK